MRVAISYIFSFILARGALFVAPLVLANSLTVSDYGKLEFAYSMAALLAILLGLGTASALPNILIRKSGTGTWVGVLHHQLLMVTIVLFFALMAWVSGLPAMIWITALCIGIVMLQGFWSITLKSLGRINASLMIDAGFWTVLACSAAFVYANGGQHFALILVATGCIYLLALYLVTLRQVDIKKYQLKQLVKEYSNGISAGVPLLFVALLAAVSANIGRLGIGAFGGVEMAGNYAVLYRATILPIVAHQILVGAWFRDLFQLSEPELRKRLCSIVVAVAIGIILFWTLSEPIGWLLGEAFMKAFASYRTEGLIILVQCILWSAISLNDLVGTRSQVAAKMARWGMIYFAAILPVLGIYFVTQPTTIFSFVLAHSGVMLGYFFTQVIVLRTAGIKNLEYSFFVLIIFFSFYFISLI